jgi:pilus assembly protein CpaF
LRSTGRALTIRKFRKDKLTLEQLVRYGSISPESAEILKVTGRCRVNVPISGGIDSGKTRAAISTTTSAS